jgi:hypothetical protein
MEEDGEALIETLREDVDSALAEASLAQVSKSVIRDALVVYYLGHIPMLWSFNSSLQACSTIFS